MNVKEAEIRINQILKQLEADTGSVVEDLSLDRIEVTNVSDTSAVYHVTAVIGLKRMPSQNWSI